MRCRTRPATLPPPVQNRDAPLGFLWSLRQKTWPELFQRQIGSVANQKIPADYSAKPAQRLGNVSPQKRRCILTVTSTGNRVAVPVANQLAKGASKDTISPDDLRKNWKCRSVVQTTALDAVQPSGITQASAKSIGASLYRSIRARMQDTSPTRETKTRSFCSTSLSTQDAGTPSLATRWHTSVRTASQTRTPAGKSSNARVAGDERPAVHDGLTHFPKSSMCRGFVERSVSSPRPITPKSRIALPSDFCRAQHPVLRPVETRWSTTRAPCPAAFPRRQDAPGRCPIPPRPFYSSYPNNALQIAWNQARMRSAKETNAE